LQTGRPTCYAITEGSSAFREKQNHGQLNPQVHKYHEITITVSGLTSWQRFLSGLRLYHWEGSLSVLENGRQ